MPNPRLAVVLLILLPSAGCSSLVSVPMRTGSLPRATGPDPGTATEPAQQRKSAMRPPRASLVDPYAALRESEADRRHWASEPAIALDTLPPRAGTRGAAMAARTQPAATSSLPTSADGPRKRARDVVPVD